MKAASNNLGLHGARRLLRETKQSIVTVILIGAISVGCRSMSQDSKANHPQGAPTISNNAYSLLYQLLNQEKDVSKLMLIKRDSRELNRLANDISTASGKAAQQLKVFGNRDKTLLLDAIDLPAGEEATRKSIAATKTRELLSTSSDSFERAFLLAQIEALNYATHLAAVAAENDSNPSRSAWSKSLSQAMKGFHLRCVEMLSRSPHGS